MKRFAALILLALFFCTSSCAEGLKADLDLTLLSGNILMNAADEIQSSPERYAGQTVRLQGQFYASVSENQIRRSLILTECSGNICREISLKSQPPSRKQNQRMAQRFPYCMFYRSGRYLRPQTENDVPSLSAF